MIKVTQIGNIYSNPARNVAFKSGPQSYELASLRNDTTKADMVQTGIWPAFNAKVERLLKLFSPEVTKRTDKLTAGLSEIGSNSGHKLDIAV